MTAIQMIKRIWKAPNSSSLIENKEDELLYQNKTDSEFILISISYVSQT